jgi:hypothetical protein
MGLWASSSPIASAFNCGNRREKFLPIALNVGYGLVPFWKVPLVPPTPGNALTGAGFARSVCKILIAKSLETKILVTKHLNPAPIFLTELLPPRQ